MILFLYYSIDMKKGKLLTKIKESIEFEDDLILEYKGFYQQFLEFVGISDESKRIIAEKITVLFGESDKHKALFMKLKELVEKEEKDEF